MRSFSQSAKSQKTVASMIIDPKKKNAAPVKVKSSKDKENQAPSRQFEQEAKSATG